MQNHFGYFFDPFSERFDPSFYPRLIGSKKIQWSDRFGKVHKKTYKIDIKRHKKYRKVPKMYSRICSCCPWRTSPSTCCSLPWASSAWAGSSTDTARDLPTFPDPFPEERGRSRSKTSFYELTAGPGPSRDRPFLRARVPSPEDGSAFGLSFFPSPHGREGHTRAFFAAGEKLVVIPPLRCYSFTVKSIEESSAGPPEILRPRS